MNTVKLQNDSNTFVSKVNSIVDSTNVSEVKDTIYVLINNDKSWLLENAALIAVSVTIVIFLINMLKEIWSKIQRKITFKKRLIYSIESEIEVCKAEIEVLKNYLNSRNEYHVNENFQRIKHHFLDDIKNLDIYNFLSLLKTNKENFYKGSRLISSADLVHSIASKLNDNINSTIEYQNDRTKEFNKDSDQVNIILHSIFQNANRQKLKVPVDSLIAECNIIYTDFQTKIKTGKYDFYTDYILKLWNLMAKKEHELDPLLLDLHPILRRCYSTKLNIKRNLDRFDHDLKKYIEYIGHYIDSLKDVLTLLGK